MNLLSTILSFSFIHLSTLAVFPTFVREAFKLAARLSWDALFLSRFATRLWALFMRLADSTFDRRLSAALEPKTQLAKPFLFSDYVLHGAGEG